MPRYLISFDDGSMDHIPDADWAAVGEAAHAAASAVLAEDPELDRPEHQPMRRVLGERYERSLELFRVG